MAGWAGSAAGELAGLRFRGGLSARTAARDAPGGGLFTSLCGQYAAVAPSERQLVAYFQLPLRSQSGSAARPHPLGGSRRVGWLQDALRQPGDRRLSHALDGRLPATAAERLFLTEGAHHGQHHLPRGGRARPGQHRQRNHSLFGKRYLCGADLVRCVVSGGRRHRVIQFFGPTGSGSPGTVP